MNAKAELLARAKKITDKASGQQRSLTADERAAVEELLERVKEIDANRAWLEGRVADVPLDMLARKREDRELRAMVENINGASSSGTGFADAVVNAGFSLKAQPSVTIPAATIFGAKAPTFPGVGDWNPLDPVIVPMGTDARFLYPNLPTHDVDAASAVQDFRQTARTLTGSVQRNLDATTDKASLDITLSLVTENLSQFAVTIPDVPNAILESISLLRDYLNSEGRFQVAKALDGHVFSQIVAASPPFGTSGADLIAKIRNAIATMRATGANPTIAVLNPTDAASLDLSADAGGYVFPTRDSGSGSPLWGLKIVERTSAAGTEPPYLIDPNMLGRLYLGTARFEADPFTGFKKNLTTLRVEVKGLFHVRNANGARRIAAT